MDKSIAQCRVQAIDDLYMYKFRTNLCSEKRRCSNPSDCFDAHSNIMKRRVPKMMKSNGGLFNYIPEPCPEWQKSRKCKMGKSCPRSHGWLETIFHPLLYKTKLCTAPRQNGVCSAKGIYCAKAHRRCEIRSLVKIYGEDWKRHYDISDRLKVKNRGRAFKANTRMATVGKGKSSGMMKKHTRKIDRVGLAVPPRNGYILDVDLFAKYLLNTKDSKVKQQLPMCFKPCSQLYSYSDNFYEDINSCEEEVKYFETGLGLGRATITSYTKLYSSEHTSEEEFEDGSAKQEVTTSAWKKQVSSLSTNSLVEDPYILSSSSISLLHDELESTISLNGLDWGNS